MTSRTPASATALSLALAGLAALPGTSLANPNLYSQETVANYCAEAQKVTASSTREALGVGHRNLSSFTFSSAAPYEGPNLSAYNGKQAQGGDLPLTVQQMVTHVTTPGTGWRMPEVISCKMKDAESMQFHFGPSAAGAQQSCRTMNEQTVAAVYAGLSSWERRTLRYQQSDIVFDNDRMLESGPAWLGSLPTFSPSTLYIGTDGMLHVIAGAVNIERTNPSTDAGPDKKGSFYCHFPAPEYIKAVIRGQIEPCTNPVLCFR